MPIKYPREIRDVIKQKATAWKKLKSGDISRDEYKNAEIKSCLNIVKYRNKYLENR